MAEKKKDPWSQWYWADWKACPEVRACSLTARGLWLEMLALMSEAEPYGHLLINGRPVSDRQLANQAGGGVSVKEIGELLEELETAGVFSRTDDRVIFSRRMVRDKAKRDEDRANGKRGGGNPYLKRGTVPKADRVRPFKRSDSPAKTRRIFDRSGGACHWCGVILAWEGDLAKNTFHVDHVIPVCDGGTNDEENLVAACADCNHKRARVDSDHNQRRQAVNYCRTNSDPKAHMPEARDQMQEVRTPMAKISEGSREHVTPPAEKPPLAVVAPIKPNPPVSDFDPERDRHAFMRADQRNRA